ncbi:MAG: hypothetical protein V7605_422 [Acidimicrobiaceae bacterium]
MSPSKSFWSGIPVLAKAIGGIVTGLVGVGSLLVALGVIGNSSSNNNSPTGTTVPSSDTPGAPGNSGGSGGGLTATTTAKASFTVDRSAVTLQALGVKEAKVTVTNQGTTSLKVKAPTLDSSPQGAFVVDASDCTTSAVSPGDSCSLKVTYSGGVQAKATMTVLADNASPVDVDLIGSLA